MRRIDEQGRTRAGCVLMQASPRSGARISSRRASSRSLIVHTVCPLELYNETRESHRYCNPAGVAGGHKLQMLLMFVVNTNFLQPRQGPTDKDLREGGEPGSWRSPMTMEFYKAESRMTFFI